MERTTEGTVQSHFGLRLTRNRRALTGATAGIGNDHSVIVRKMWSPSGPLRHWSSSQTAKAPTGYSEVFVGGYVCARCLASCDGVYSVTEPPGWVCGSCKRKLEPSGGEYQ